MDIAEAGRPHRLNGEAPWGSNLYRDALSMKYGCPTKHETLYMSITVHIFTNKSFTLEFPSPDHYIHRPSPTTEDSSSIIIPNVSAPRIKHYVQIYVKGTLHEFPTLLVYAEL